MRTELSAHKSSVLYRLVLNGIIASILLFSVIITQASEPNQQPPVSGVVGRPSRDLDRLFGEEMKTAIVKLKWHGERLTEDTIYAVALTGASWEAAWSKEALFSLAWGDSHKIPTLRKRNLRDRDALISDIRSLYQARQYRRVVDTTSADFSLDEIGCDVNLKECVGGSLVALGQPEQAFPVYSAPFEPLGTAAKISDENFVFRQAALKAAARAGLKKEAVAFSLSLLMNPDPYNAKPDTQQIEYLEKVGVDVDRVLRGVLQAPERLKALSAYDYAASDLLVFRANPRVVPIMLQLSNSSDVYLHARALLGLGMVAYEPHSGEPPGWAQSVVFAIPREFSVSSGERKLIDKALRDGAASDRYRLRAAAALAMGLTGDQDYEPILQKLSKDRAYVLLEENGAPGKSRRISYPVRMAAAAALERLGISASAGPSGVLSGKELDRAKHGGTDETNDHRNVRKDVASIIAISPLEVTNVPHR